MFGYVLPNREELKLRELKEYQAYYCGLCRCLKEKYGLPGQISLNYDMTFLGMLLTSLYEPNITEKDSRCIAHPAHKHLYKKSTYVDYAADMNILLTYYKCMDDWKDEHKLLKAGYGRILLYKGRKISQKYPDKAKKIKDGLSKLAMAEKDNCDDIDYVAGCFGDICAAVFVYKEDEWSQDLSRFGYFLGKFIYLIDAYEDLEKDREKGCYNPFIFMKNVNETKCDVNTDDRIRQILIMMISEAGRAFERLPVIHNAEILRNIIYSGVWCRFETVRAENQCSNQNDK